MLNCITIYFFLLNCFIFQNYSPIQRYRKYITQLKQASKLISSMPMFSSYIDHCIRRLYTVLTDILTSLN